NVTIPSYGFNELHYAAMAGSTSLAENHFKGEHGAVLLNVVIGAGLMEVAYELITTNPGLCTIEYESVKYALMKIVENFDLYYSQPEKSRNLDHNIAKKLQAERRDRVDQKKLPSCLESDKKPLILLRSICNKLHKKDTLFDTRYYFMEAATLSVRLDIIEALKEITTHFPDALMMKQEGFHLIEAAILRRSKKVIDYWVYGIPDDNKYHILNLKTYKDENNLLHMAAMSAPLKEVDEIPNPALRMHKEVLWFKVSLFFLF
nr:hypothetical protein [Tanacetum cinerariifolium]